MMMHGLANPKDLTVQWTVKSYH